MTESAEKLLREALPDVEEILEGMLCEGCHSEESLQKQASLIARIRAFLDTSAPSAGSSEDKHAARNATLCPDCTLLGKPYRTHGMADGSYAVWECSTCNGTGMLGDRHA